MDLVQQQLLGAIRQELVSIKMLMEHISLSQPELLKLGHDGCPVCEQAPSNTSRNN